MKICQVNTRAMLAAFRIPETQTFHQTLPLPPITTCVGILGAALGKEYTDIFNFASQQGIFFGVSGDNRGETKDLWNYRKVTTKEKKFTREDIRKRKNYSIVLKEYLFDCRFDLYFGHEEPNLVLQFAQAFKNPVFPLTAGNSDDLLKIESVNVHDCRQSAQVVFKNTIISGDLAGKYSVSSDVFLKPVYETIKSPRTFSLPVEFSFNNGIRKVTQRRSFTFVGDKITLTEPVAAYCINEENFEINRL